MAWFRTSILFGALLLLTPAFKNNFPFLYADTATYLFAGFQKIFSPLRPMFYGFFMRHVSLLESLWLVVFVQSWIVSALIHLFFRTFSFQKNDIRPLLSILFLTLFTTISLSTGMLMPDFLTACMALSCIIFVFGKNVRLLHSIFCGIVLCFGLLSHHSHFYILLISAAFLTLFLFFQKKWRSEKHVLAKSSFVLLLTIVSFWGMKWFHFSQSGTFKRENAAHVFLLNRLNRMGQLEDFLSQKCPTEKYDICKYCCEIPSDFLWDSESPANIEHQGWEVLRDDYMRIIEDFLTDPMYGRKFVFGTLENTISQFFCFEGKLIFPEKKGGWGAYWGIKENWPEQLNQIPFTLQYHDKWKHEEADTRQRFSVYGSLVFLLILFVLYPKSQTVEQKHIAYFLFVFLIANALICGGVSMVDPRFQARVVWLIPFYAFFILSIPASNLFAKIKHKLKE